MDIIFISHSSKDKAYVLRLADALSEAGFEPWIDTENSNSTDSWWNGIDASIKKCVAMIVIMTPDSEASKWVQKELMLAYKYSKKIIPILVSGEIFSILIDQNPIRTNPNQLPDIKLIQSLIGGYKTEVNRSTSPNGKIISNARSAKPFVYPSRQHYLADLRLIEQSWFYLNSKRMLYILEAVAGGLSTDYVEKYIVYGYQEFRRRPETSFIHPDLQKALKSFDEVFSKFITKLYVVFDVEYVRDGRYFIPVIQRENFADLDLDKQDNIRAMFNEIWDLIDLVKKRHAKFIEKVRLVLPSFTFPELPLS